MWADSAPNSTPTNRFTIFPRSACAPGASWSNACKPRSRPCKRAFTWVNWWKACSARPMAGSRSRPLADPSLWQLPCSSQPAQAPLCHAPFLWQTASPMRAPKCTTTHPHSKAHRIRQQWSSAVTIWRWNGPWNWPNIGLRSPCCTAARNCKHSPTCWRACTPPSRTAACSLWPASRLTTRN